MNLIKVIFTFFACALPLCGNAQTLLTEFNNGLYDTGLGNATAGNNATTLNGGDSDTHYVLTSLPGGASVTAGSDALVVHQANLPAAWVANDTGATPPSRWDSSSATAANQPAGTYDYALTLTNIPVNSLVSISGNIAADNQVNILANGTVVFSLTTNANYDTALNPFSFTFNSSTLSTTDTLSFNVINTGNSATGLQVQGLAGNYTPVPEPRQSMALILLFVGAIVAVRKLQTRSKLS